MCALCTKTNDLCVLGVMKQFLLSLGLVVVSAFYVLFINEGSISVIPPVTVPATAANNPPSQPIASSGNPPGSGTPIATVTPTPAPAATTPQKTTPAPTPAPTPATAPAPKPKGLYINGSYKGSVADAYYGNVQVKAIISGGKISDVQFLQYPNTHSTSVYINSQAMPYLTQEAIQAQSANVNIVSGATDTSIAFQQSLAAALSSAKS